MHERVILFSSTKMNSGNHHFQCNRVPIDSLLDKSQTRYMHNNLNTTAHCQHHLTNNFDEVLEKSPKGISATMKISNDINLVTRLVSAPYDEKSANAAADVPLAVPVSPCSFDTLPDATPISITGNFTNIEEQYHIDARVLGTGHHGSVRRCIDRTTGQRCAVKTIRKSEPSVKPTDLYREIELLHTMNQESIIRLLDVYEDAAYIHLVTDLCTGGELFDKIVENNSNSTEDNSTSCFHETETSRILFQILTAISYMHKTGVVHRDIKPENILFETKDADSPVKIIDFGLARRHSSLDRPMKSVVGTPYYIAPEVLRKCYNKSCDLWSVGVIAYIMLCGYPPFNGANNKEVYRAVIRGQYRFPSLDWKNSSRESRDFIQRLLLLDPSHRMTAEQALNHPFIVKHNLTMRFDESRDESVEVVFGSRSHRDAIFVGE